jgi:hypothetical protein
MSYSDERISRKGAGGAKKTVASSLRLCAFAGNFFSFSFKLTHYTRAETEKPAQNR